ncbi:glycosyltransferase family 4 protein [Bordetella genomosp. 9]|uniref:glycosyltransferase family 4 protein n=1 Tax=Bordetella genomosp. 9 TaxID=1416803 RepID=UPI0018DF8C48|nr:glycosyltransferase family 4 protein [Bordetella genomosp. 9]
MTSKNGREGRPVSIPARYGFLNPVVTSEPWDAADVAKNTVNWFLPDVGPASGGHLNILRFIRMLEEEGFDCRIIAIGNVYPDLDPAQLGRNIASWYFPLRAKTYVGLKDLPAASVSIATSWETAYAVRAFQATTHKCYFVQDFEPYFYPVGSDSAFAEATYRFGFVGITAGDWLAQKLHAEYGMRTHALGFSYDRSLYRAQPFAEGRKKKHIFFYARPATARRGFELGIMALKEVARRMPEAVAVLAGGSIDGYDVPFPHIDAGVVSLDKLGDLYARCDAALVLSFTNLSLLPLELMACGVPVVSNRAPCTEWLLTDENARMAEPTVEALADALCSILGNPAERERLRAAGLRTAAQSDWKKEGKKLSRILRELVQQSIADAVVES